MNDKNISGKPILCCATGNAEKFALGLKAFEQVGVTLEQVIIAADEIQGEDPEVIIKDKARRAFETLDKPVLVSDDSWAIPALNGFPGPYMKSVNHWFTPEDFLALMAAKQDRSVFLQQYLAYIDEFEIVLFQKTLRGSFVTSPRGETGPPIMHVVTLEGDNNLTIAEVYDKGLRQKETGRDAWTDAAAWYAKKLGKA